MTDLTLTREERIYILMRRRGWRCPQLARRVQRWGWGGHGENVKPDTLYRILNRKVKRGGRGRAAHVKRILAACEVILLEVER